jgi:hypothetical protein
MAQATYKPAKIELLPPERKAIDPILEQLADWMDTRFEVPGLRWRFGLDALLGLIPGLGDAVTFFVSCYMLSAAARLGVPRIVIVRMALNVAVDLVIGSIPVLGDLLDVAWKANTRNLQLLRRTLETPLNSRRRTAWTDWVIVIGGLAALFVALMTIVFLTWTAIGWVFAKLTAGI